ncbi:MAG: hypothetical protein AAB668_01385 [Patescibacteria group bacterium]
MKSSSKTSVKTPKSVKSNKDWHGPHWHSVGWIAAVALVLSASTMTLSVSAASAPASRSASLRDINEIKAQLSRLEIKIDLLLPTNPTEDAAD